ncbi:MAG: extracellular solute-binding protein [Acidimicrobiia bacterium]|nr:extracellular solute-binding protein [Acidimicrobiia bacterium]MYB23677.1 extracellular solute-binding protein [Acidimicrobiia bacterium]MYE66892.1 extracellular solute-binding protein [Acidimicrobiia bacterium]MYJ14617.1 extracellular solute-binding protein [Acidimicrobiia bacterium]
MDTSSSTLLRRAGRGIWLVAAVTALSLVAAACGSDDDGAPVSSRAPASPVEPAPPPPPEPGDPLTIYSGRSEDLISPLVEMFEETTEIEADVRYGSSADLALLIEAEGDATPADVFISQSPGAMGYLATQGRLRVLPSGVLDAVDSAYAAGDGTWVGFSGRQRVLVYNPNLVDPADLPDSVLDLTDLAYDGRVAVAPANSSFQDFITAMRFESGDDATLSWLEGMAANNAPNYPKNSAIVDAVLRGEVDMGLVNHYYLLRFLAEDPDAPGVNHSFAFDDIGALLIVTTGAILDASDQPTAAQAFIEFMLTRQAQEFYASETREYPLAAGVQPPEGLAPLNVADVMDTIDFDVLGGGLARTQELIDQSGIVR